MIIYDFSLHVFDTLRNLKKINTKHPFGMYILMDYFGGKNKFKRTRVYDIFWTSYWGIASVLIVFYILFK